MNILKSLSLCMLLGIGVSNAQQVTVTCPNDPIVEMLDSLVTLNNVVRFNKVTTYGEGITSNNNLPNYSDEIYSQRISKIYSPIPLTYNDQVKQYIDLYAYRKRELTSRVLGLSNLYFPLFEQILDQQGLPLEFKYLSVVESALNPLAVSRVGATGLWQFFMYNTGKLYDLKTSSYFDDRKDPVKSTYAACKYFKDMYSIYGDWLLVIAAYNCGAGNVNKAIKRSGGKTNFWEISKYLPAETRGYVPAFIAVAYVMNYSSEHNLFPITPAYNYFEVDTVSVDQSISLKKISDAIDLPLDAISFLNPIYKRGIIPDTEYPNILRLPANKVAAYISAEEQLFAPPLPDAAIADGVGTTDAADDSNSAKVIAVNEKVNQASTLKYKKVKKSYIVRAGDNLSALARRFECSITDLKKWNSLRSGSLLKGQRLSYFETVKVKVPVTEKEVTASVPEQKSDTACESVKKGVDKTKNSDSNIQSRVTSDGKFIYHLVQKGDTLWNIAKRYEGVTVEDIIEINSITDITNLKPGTKLKVMING